MEKHQDIIDRNKWRPQVGRAHGSVCLLQVFCNRWNCPDASLFIVHICLEYSAERRQGGQWKDCRQWLPPWIPIMPIPQWFMESLAKAGDKRPSHIVIKGWYQRTGISVSHPSLPRGPDQTVCLPVYRCACVCYGGKLAMTRGALLVASHVCVCPLEQIYYDNRQPLWSCFIGCVHQNNKS